MMHSWKLIRKLLAVFFAFILSIFIIYPFKETNHCINNSHIFFVETSHSNILTTRQACAIESSARHNPSFHVTVLMTSLKSIDFSNNLMASLINLSNVQIIRINLEEFLCGTPIWNWFASGKWKNSIWKASHLSDALRFFLIWKYGGIYLDMDVVVLRSMENLKNTAVTENWDRVASGILIFDKGHELMKRCMSDFAKNYDPSNFVANGPGIITRNIKNYCDINDIGKVSGANCNIDIQPPESAFPIPYDKWKDYFIHSSTSNEDLFNSSYLLHVWNKYSKRSKLVIGKRSLYELAMQEHCPLAYENAYKLGYA